MNVNIFCTFLVLLITGQMSAMATKRKVAQLNLSVDPVVTVTLDFTPGTYLLLMGSLMAGVLLIALILFGILVGAGVTLFSLYTKRLNRDWLKHHSHEEYPLKGKEVV